MLLLLLYNKKQDFHLKILVRHNSLMHQIWYCYLHSVITWSIYLLTIHFYSFHQHFMIHSPSSSKNRNCCQNEEKINPQRPGAKLDAVIQGGGKQTVWATLTKKVNSEGFSAREKKKKTAQDLSKRAKCAWDHRDERFRLFIRYITKSPILLCLRLGLWILSMPTLPRSLHL